VVEQQGGGARPRIVIFGAGILAWAYALALTEDVDFGALLAGVPSPWGTMLAAPFHGPVLPFGLAISAGLGMVMLVTEAPRRLRVYGALVAFTAPLYAAARLLATN